MIPIIRKNMTLKEKAELENAIASVKKNRSDIEFIAMVADIDIFEDGMDEMEDMDDGEE